MWAWESIVWWGQHYFYISFWNTGDFRWPGGGAGKNKNKSGTCIGGHDWCEVTPRGLFVTPPYSWHELMFFTRWGTQTSQLAFRAFVIVPTCLLWFYRGNNRWQGNNILLEPIRIKAHRRSCSSIFSIEFLYCSAKVQYNHLARQKLDIPHGQLLIQDIGSTLYCCLIKQCCDVKPTHQWHS